MTARGQVLARLETGFFHIKVKTDHFDEIVYAIGRTPGRLVRSPFLFH